MMKLDSLPFVYQQIFRESKRNNELQRSSFKKKSSDTCFAKQESEVKNKTADRKSFIFLGFNANKESLTDWDCCFFI